MIVLKSPAEIEIMRQAGRILADIMDTLIDKVKPGITTLELDKIAEAQLKKSGATPAFKGYRGFPRSICVSVNEEVVHGIPGARYLLEGDIVSIDIGVRYNGLYSDSAVTVAVGAVDNEKQRLINTAKEALNSGIEAMTTANRLSDICASIQKVIEGHGFSIVRDFVGHGIGSELHEDPQIPNFGEPGHGARIKEGMVFAIEPMVNAGCADVKIDNADKWTVKTVDKKPSAHFEHTVALTHKGQEILTWRKTHP